MNARELLWHLLAFVVSRRPVARYLIRRARRTPYFHLDGYMSRWWLFNGYGHGRSDMTDAQRQEAKRFPSLPSIRIHHILREDLAKHKHDHPWLWARTFILDGWYIESREFQPARVLNQGDTASIGFGEYHHIERVSEGGVWTMFVVGPWGGKWGFDVEGVKVAPRDYVVMFPERAA